MKLKISEKMLSEFIGVDLEPIEGADSDKRGNQTFVNIANDRGDAPPTTTDINRQATKRKDLLMYLWGHYGGRQYGFASESAKIDEDVFANRTPDNSVISQGSEPNLSDISTLFQEEVLEQDIRNVIKNLKAVAKRKTDEEMRGINFTILSYIIQNIDTSKLTDQEKRTLINGIK